MSNTEISSNKASEEGGGIFFFCYQEARDECSLELRNARVTGNRAAIGGGVKWNYRSPDPMNPDSVRDNSAEHYGKDFAAFPSRIVSIGEDLFNKYLEFQAADRLDPIKVPFDSDLTNQEYSNVQSGNVIPAYFYAVLDLYD